jgi:hypothetical protein
MSKAEQVRTFKAAHKASQSLETGLQSPEQTKAVRAGIPLTHSPVQCKQPCGSTKSTGRLIGSRSRKEDNREMAKLRR